jgi:hypothetical protein
MEAILSAGRPIRECLNVWVLSSGRQATLSDCGGLGSA